MYGARSVWRAVHWRNLPVGEHGGVERPPAGLLRSDSVYLYENLEKRLPLATAIDAGLDVNPQEFDSCLIALTSTRLSLGAIDG